MSWKPEILADLKNYDITTLDSRFPIIKFGHVENILQTFGRGNKSRAPLLKKYLYDNWQIDLEISELQNVLSQFGKLKKNISQKNGVSKMIAHYSEVFFEGIRPLNSAQTKTVSETNNSVSTVKSTPTPYSTLTLKSTSTQTLCPTQVATTYACRSSNLLSTPRDFAIARRETSKLKSEVQMLNAANSHLQQKVNSLKKTVNQYKGRVFRSQRNLQKLRGKHSEILTTLASTRRSRTMQCKKLDAEKENSSSTVKAITEPLSKKVNDIQCVINSYEIELANLKEQLEEKETTKVITKQKGRYTNEVRKCVYICARKQVPIHSVSTVIKEIGKHLFAQDISPLPSASTVCGMISEMGVLAAVQAVDAMLNSPYVNIAWDATTLNGAHINEIHVNTATGSFALNVGKLAGGNTEDYYQHIKETLESSCKLYSNNQNVNYDQTLASVKLSITSTLSDRAAVNKCVARKLEEYLGHKLLDLNCNVHPLDSLSIAFKKLCREYENENEVHGALLGSDSALLRVIVNLTKMRYSDGKGDPSGMIAFFRTNKLDSKLIMRYVGNRFHVLFELAGNIYFLREHLKRYLNDVCSKGEGYREQMLHDLSLEVVQSELVVCGLFGKCLTGPWMTCLYRKAGLTNLGSCGPLSYMVLKLKELIACPRLLWDKDFCCFDTPFYSASSELSKSVYESLCNFSPSEAVLRLASRTATVFLKVVERQAERYLPGGELSDLEPDSFVLASNAPADNMFAEGLLGLTDNISRKCSNATELYVTSKSCFSVNSTYAWLDSLDDICLQRATSQARSLKVCSTGRRRDIEAEICKRLSERSQHRADLRRKKLTRQTKSIISDPVNFSSNVLKVDPDILPAVIDSALSVVRRPKSLEGREFVWIWNEDAGDVLYNYRVVKKRKTAEIRYKALCWTSSESFEDAVDSGDFSLVQFVTDLLVGDIWFI